MRSPNESPGSRRGIPRNGGRCIAEASPQMIPFDDLDLSAVCARDRPRSETNPPNNGPLAFDGRAPKRKPLGNVPSPKAVGTIRVIGTCDVRSNRAPTALVWPNSERPAMPAGKAVFPNTEKALVLCRRLADHNDFERSPKASSVR